MSSAERLTPYRPREDLSCIDHDVAVRVSYIEGPMQRHILMVAISMASEKLEPA